MARGAREVGSGGETIVADCGDFGPEDGLNHPSVDSAEHVQHEPATLPSSDRRPERALPAWDKSVDTLHISATYLREIVDRLSGVVYSYEVDANGLRSLVHVGPGFDRLVGHSIATRIAAGDVDAYFEMVHPDDLELMRSKGQFEPAFAQPVDQEYRLRTGSGTYKWIRALASPRRLDNGRLRWLGMLMDVTEQKQVEQDLRVKNQAVATSMTPTALTDLEGTITYVNRAFLDAWGYEHEDEVVGRMNTEFAPPSSRIEQGMESVRTYGCWMGEDKAIRKDGTIFDIQLAASRVTDADNRPLCVMASFVDITERKRAEKALRESEERFRALFEQAADSVVLFDPQTGAIVEFNERAHKSLGYTREEFVRCRLADIDVVESAEEVIRHSAEVAVRGADVFETKHRTKKGDIRDVLVTARAVSIGGRTLISAVWRDITSRKRAEKALQYRIAFESLITSISTKFINLTPDRIDGGIRDALKSLGDFADVDRSYVFMLSADGTRFSNTHEWCAPGVSPAIDRLQNVSLDVYPWFWSRMKRRETVHVPDVSTLPSDAHAERTEWGQEGIKSLICVPMVCGGTLLGLVGFDSVREWKTWPEQIIALLRIVGEVFANALERKRAEEQHEQLEAQLRQALKLQAVGQLAAGVAHDFNNLLMVILGNVEMLRRMQSSSGEGRGGSAGEAWDLILSSIERGKTLINKLMEFGRTQSSKPQWVEPNQLLSTTLGMLRGLLGKHIDIDEDLAPRVKRIRIDPGQLEQVIVNLVLNARDAMPHGGTLTIRTRNIAIDESYAASHPGAAVGAHVMIGVQDAGSGMDDETRERVFEPFFSTKPVGKGSGLGLSVVHGIVTQAGGHIEVESKPGEGSAFKLYFPAVE